jgi:hypothetical protein
VRRLSTERTRPVHERKKEREKRKMPIGRLKQLDGEKARQADEVKCQ